MEHGNMNVKTPHGGWKLSKYYTNIQFYPTETTVRLYCTDSLFNIARENNRCL